MYLDSISKDKSDGVRRNLLEISIFLSKGLIPFYDLPYVMELNCKLIYLCNKYNSLINMERDIDYLS